MMMISLFAQLGLYNDDANKPVIWPTWAVDDDNKPVWPTWAVYDANKLVGPTCSHSFAAAYAVLWLSRAPFHPNYYCSGIPCTLLSTPSIPRSHASKCMCLLSTVPSL